MNKIVIIIFLLLASLFTQPISAQEQIEEDTTQAEEQNVLTDPLMSPIFDDSRLLHGYIQKYKEIPKDILLEMLKDETLASFKTAAAVHIFTTQYSNDVVSREKRRVEKTLVHRLKRTDSPFVQVEIMSALCHIDRYKYFNSMIPQLMTKLDHYNDAVNEFAFIALESLLDNGNNRSREARIVFKRLQKILFLQRNRLAATKEPDKRLTQKLKLLRWSIKILGTQELKELPKEVIDLL